LAYYQPPGEVARLYGRDGTVVKHGESHSALILLAFLA
jgi:hypothetical protein